MVSHTNHYLENDFANLNKQTRESSRVRLRRVGELMKGVDEPWNLADFFVLSQDENAGPDNSIRRKGSSSQKSQTLASFMVHLLPNGGFKGLVKYRSLPGDIGREKMVEFSDEDF